MESVLDIRKNHITLKKIYINEVKNKSLTRIFRPGNRIQPNEKSYYVSQKAFIKFLDIQGSDIYKIEPIHLKDKFLVQIKFAKCVKLKDLKKSDFKNCGIDITSIENLKYHLALIYNLDLDLLNDKNFEVTIFDFEYL